MKIQNTVGRQVLHHIVSPACMIPYLYRYLQCVIFISSTGTFRQKSGTASEFCYGIDIDANFRGSLNAPWTKQEFFLEIFLIQVFSVVMELLSSKWYFIMLFTCIKETHVGPYVRHRASVDISVGTTFLDQLYDKSIQSA